MPEAKWYGQGNPPSREAAIEWAIAHGAYRDEAERRIPSGAPVAMGDAARHLAEDVRVEFITGKRPWAIPGEGAYNDNNLGAIVATMLGAEPGSTFIRAETPVRFDVPNRVRHAELEDLIAAGPGGTPGSSRGAALWPYDASEETLAGLSVENRAAPMAGPESTTDPRATFDPADRAKPGDRVGARYYVADTLAPLRWSQERRADLQRLMQQVGLYGDKPVRFGSWSAEDQAMFAEVLATSNVEGVRWFETLAGWRRAGLPPDLLEQINGAQPKRPTIRVTSPVDIRQTAQAVSQQLTGAIDPAFVESSVGPVQQSEVVAQQAVSSDQAGGGGGVVTSAPAADAVLEDKLRREKPLEVDGYQFLGQFNAFLQMIGAAG